jgi:cell division protein ZapE
MGVRELYQQTLRERGFTADPAQLAAVDALERCETEWETYLSRRLNAVTRLLIKPPIPRGVYMYGGVGCGKSLLMDTFFEVAPLDPSRKRRVHFHEFMLEMHRRMHELRQANPDMGDPMPYIAYDISSATSLICFDEFQVTDVADALVMRRLFRYLFAHGLVLVATSNRKPDELYKNGIQRASFLPFIADLKERCYVHDLASGTDYRTLAAVTATEGGTYLHPLVPQTKARMDQLFATISKSSAPKIESPGHYFQK